MGNLGSEGAKSLPKLVPQPAWGRGWTPCAPPGLQPLFRTLGLGPAGAGGAPALGFRQEKVAAPGSPQSRAVGWLHREAGKRVGKGEVCDFLTSGRRPSSSEPPFPKHRPQVTLSAALRQLWTPEPLRRVLSGATPLAARSQRHRGHFRSFPPTNGACAADRLARAQGTPFSGLAHACAGVDVVASSAPCASPCFLFRLPYVTTHHLSRWHAREFPPRRSWLRYPFCARPGPEPIFDGETGPDRYLRKTGSAIESVSRPVPVARPWSPLSLSFF